MGFLYTLELKLAKQTPDVDLVNYESEIESVMKDYNETSARSYNKKALELCKLDKNSIIVRLNSQVKLATAGKALKYFSQCLIVRIPTLGANITSGGQLFRIKELGSVISEDEDPDIQMRAREVEDAALINALVNYVCKKRDPDTSAYLKKQRAIEKMKQLALQSGLL